MAGPVAAVRGYRRDALTWVAFAALFAFGVLNAVLGPVLPYLRATQHTSYLVGSLHQVAFAVGYVAAGVQASRSHAPRRPVIVGGLLVAAAAGVALGYGHVLAVTLPAVLVMSAAATAALIRVWAVLADHHRERRAVAMTEGEVSVSLAGVVTPLVIGACAASALGWRFSMVVTAAIVVVAVLAVRRAPIPEALAPAPPPPPGWVTTLPRRRRLPPTLVTILAVVSLEMTLSFWAASYLHDVIGLDRDTAATSVSVLYAAQLLGRVLASRLARRVTPAVLLRAALVVALAGCPVLLAAGSPAVALVGLGVAGCGIGGMFPLAASLHVAASPRSADQTLGQILTVAGVGQVVGPLAAGIGAQLADLRAGLLVLPVLVVVAAATTWHRRPVPVVGASV
ncbi:MFS transporter [Jatrophihabitans sp. YIM 134969]